METEGILMHKGIAFGAGGSGGSVPSNLVDLIYPVGSIYMSVNNTNPSVLFGGTWEAWGSGKVPVGVDANDEDFDEAEATGGAKTHTLDSTQIPAHTHSVYGNTGANSVGHTHSGTTGTISANHSHSVNCVNHPSNRAGHIPGGGGTEFDVGQSSVGTGTVSANHTHSFTTGGQSANHTHLVNLTSGSTGGGLAHNNLQPYITCYMWKRTA